MKNKNRGTFGIIISIIFTLTILIGGTYLWKNLNDNYALANSIVNNDMQVIEMKDIDVCSDKESNKLYGYNFVITSNYDTLKNYNVKIMSDNIKLEDIHYTIDNSEIMTLNSDGIILNKNILAKDEHNYIFKVWSVKDYNNNDINVLIRFE